MPIPNRRRFRVTVDLGYMHFRLLQELTGRGGYSGCRYTDGELIREALDLLAKARLAESLIEEIRQASRRRRLASPLDPAADA